jgi:UDP-2,3-diacylglucosamine pyrophosphatase LpxH
VRYVTHFEVAMATLARRNGVDGIICGHIHKAEIRDMDGIRYLNCGDWVENCTALVEDLDGTIRLIHFHEQSALPQPFASRSEVRTSNPSKEPHPLACP